MTLNPTVCDYGYARVAGLLTPEECSGLLEALGPVDGAGRRGLLDLPVVRDLARSPRLAGWLQPHLTGPARPVRALYFDKSPEANWLVPWHQDLSFAVQERQEVPGFGPWSVKDGIPHVQPPTGLLEQVLTLRLHLDPCDASNGALKVLPGTHRKGRLGSADIQAYRAEIDEVLCDMAAGDALLMRPLLLHASGRSTTDRHRRILHLEYAGFDLPAGLQWHEG